jgi:hypothetical protein
MYHPDICLEGLRKIMGNLVQVFPASRERFESANSRIWTNMKEEC